MERDNYKKLARTWGRTLTIYHNLPFLNVFTTEGLIDSAGFLTRPIEIDASDKARLKKTSLDYVLCNTEDQPLIAIDFDGLCEGFNVGTSYHPHYPPTNPWREQITELKLRVAHGSQFPYFVLGSSQFADLGPDVKLCAVDGIIGEVLARRQVQARAAQGVSAGDFGLTHEEFEALPPDEQQDLLQDWVTGVEVDADFATNPVTKKHWQLQMELKLQSYSTSFLNYPPVPDSASLAERAALISRAVLEGCSFVIEDPEFGRVEAIVMLPCFQTPHFSGLGVAEELAGILAMNRLKRLRSGRIADSSLHDL